MATVNILPALLRKALTPFLVYALYTRNQNPHQWTIRGQKKVAHQKWEILVTIFTTESLRDSYLYLAFFLLKVLSSHSSEIMWEKKTYRPGPSPLRLVQNTVHQGIKSHLLSSEDGSISSEEKNDALPYTQAVRGKQRPSDKEGNLPLHPCKSNIDPDTRAELHLLTFWAAP